MTNQDQQKKEEYDYVNPNHYKKGDKEVWEMMVAIWGKEAYMKHCEMCAFKYRQRLGLKPNQPVERDLAKAKWYEDMAARMREELQTVTMDFESKDKIKDTIG